MSRKLPQLWAKKGCIQVPDVGWGYFVVKFDTIGDYERAMFGGPWMVGDHYIVIQDWRPYFQPEDSPISTLRVWVRLLGIPLEYYDAAILTIIGNRIGKTVRLDGTTLEGSRGNFARICVEVDLSKPLLSKYRLRRRIRRIEYEGLHTICYSCGCYGHALDRCPSKESADPAATSDVLVDNLVFLNKCLEDPCPEVDEDFGPWMKMSRSNRKGKKPAPSVGAPAATPPATTLPAVEDSILGNKFEVLSREDSQGVDGAIPDHIKESTKEPTVEEEMVDADQGNADKKNIEDPMEIIVNGMPRVQPVSSSVLKPEGGPQAQQTSKPSLGLLKTEVSNNSKPAIGATKGVANSGLKKNKTRTASKGVKQHSRSVVTTDQGKGTSNNSALDHFPLVNPLSSGSGGSMGNL
ncbi:hypothetical protein LINPERPRIM_LOCUS26198 [Linum perenne]